MLPLKARRCSVCILRPLSRGGGSNPKWQCWLRLEEAQLVHQRLRVNLLLFDYRKYANHTDSQNRQTDRPAPPLPRTLCLHSYFLLLLLLLLLPPLTPPLLPAAAGRGCCPCSSFLLQPFPPPPSSASSDARRQSSRSRSPVVYAAY